LTTVAAIMRDEAMDMVPVINRDGSVVGIVTTTDIIDLLAGYDPRQRQH
jgi:CBS domain-containing protein